MTRTPMAEGDRTPVPARERSCLVEVIGPAGAGKTTLVRALADGGMRVGISTSRLAVVRGAASSGRFLPAGLAAPGRWFDRDEIRSIAYLGAWRRAVRRGLPDDTVLDHGPLFRLVQLRTFGPPVARSVAFSRWWRLQMTLWGSALDLIVHLDTTDGILVRRVRARGRAHPLLDLDATAAADFIARYRRDFHDAVAFVSSSAGRVLTFDSADRSPDEIAEEVLHAIERGRTHAGA